MDVVLITKHEVEIHFDDDDERMLKEGWMIEQTVDKENKILTIAIVSRP